MRDRAFGVEIECGYNGPGIESPDCVCVYDEELGEYVAGDEHCEACCGCWDEGSESGCRVAEQLLWANGFGHWTDEIHEDGTGVEIPSPVLRGAEGLRELRCVMQLLSSNGFYTTESDGMHVHHDAPEFVEDEVLTARLVEMWEENLPVIDRFVAYERRGGEHWACNSYKEMMTRYYSGPSPWDEFKASKSLGDLYRDKFRSLNVTALNEHGTIEFRLHEGTLDFEKARAWIHFGQAFLETAKRRKTILTCAEPLDLLRATRTSPKSTRTLLQYAAA